MEQTQMSCILRISGDSLDVDALLSQHSLPADSNWRKGESHILRGKTHSDSGVSFVASEADLDEFNRQVTEAAAFLDFHASPTSRQSSSN
ncbi:hypothetical protein [Anthocerotibacter panamensis]|uniref:hypothetical protein n=1 Tax=Anthocerotibacter panamensis TaxID=2857077 RepID=UPI001C4042B2|nr:hypothetical protein [Anthocerotibacter panamensis]